MKLARHPHRALLCAMLSIGGLAIAAPGQQTPVYRLLDLNTTGQSGLNTYFDPLSFVAAGGHVYFPAWSFAEGFELWCSDGTEGGTRLTADLLPGSFSSAPAQLTPTADGQRLYFLASDSTGDFQIYLVQHPEFTPHRLTSFEPPSVGAPAILGTAGPGGDTLIFSRPVNDQVGLWSARDPGQPPVLLRTFVAGPIGAAFGGTDVAVQGSRLYFAADDGSHGRELWRTDGTPGGTILFADAVPGPVSSNPTAITPIDQLIYFAAGAPGGGTEPWVCEPGGVRQFAVIEPPGSSLLGSLPSGYAAVGSRIVFSAQTDATGRELWVTDSLATPGATRLLRDLNPGPADGIARPFESVLIDGRLYFSGNDGAGGFELWSTDGTDAGTRLEADVRPGPIGSGPASFLAVGAGSGPRTQFIFQAAHNDYGYRLWRARPGAATMQTALLSDLPFSDDLNVNRLSQRPVAAIGSTVLFPAFRIDTGLELFRASADSGESGLVRDIRAGTTSSAPAQLARVGNGVIFAARNELGVEPWVSDGMPEQTRMLADLSPGRTGSNPASLVPGRSFAMFRATVSGQVTWWRSGTHDAGIGSLPAGAVSMGLAEPLQSIAPRAASLGPLMVFAARTPQTGDEPFVTDGAQTWLLADIASGTRGSSPFYFFRVGDRVLFFASVTPGTAEIWSTRGTPESTELVTTIINPTGPRVVSPTVRPVVAGDRLFFVANDGAGDELWLTTGEDVGTRMVADIVPGEGSSSPANLAASTAGDGSVRLFFTAADLEAGNELWVCSVPPDDNAIAQRVADILPGPGGSFPFSLTAGPSDPEGRAYFVATDGVHGFELWSSSGFAGDARRLTDLRSSPDIAVQSVLGIVGTRIFVRVVDPGVTSFSGHLFVADPDSPTGASPVLNRAGERIVPTSNLLLVNSRAFLGVSDVFAGSELAVLDFCPADFDNSGAVSIEDLLRFLAAWVPRIGETGTDSAADFTADGAIAVDDLFEYLRFFFAPCQ